MFTDLAIDKTIKMFILFGLTCKPALQNRDFRGRGVGVLLGWGTDRPHP
jgi:hypothetical protein